MSAPVIVAVEDLFFRARIEAAAKALKIPVQIVTEPGRLERLDSFQGCLLDLEMPDDRALAILRALPPGHATVGYCSHVNERRMAEARELGCQVMPRSQITAQLVEVLRELWTRS